MCVDAHVADGADEVLGLCVVHVFPGGVPEGLGQPEVHHVDLAAVVQAEHAVLGICDVYSNFRLQGGPSGREPTGLFKPSVYFQLPHISGIGGLILKPFGLVVVISCSFCLVYLEP